MFSELRSVARGASILAAGVFCFVPASASGDEIYRWVDAEGRVIYGSEPPAGAADTQKWTPSREGTVTIVPGLAPPQAPHAPPNVAVPPPSAYGGVQGNELDRVGGKSEAQWREQAARMLKKIESRQARIERIEEELSFPSRFRSSFAAAKYEARQRHRVETLAGEIAEIESELDALRRAARKLGVPPGWLR